MRGALSKSPLEVSQLIMRRLAALIAGEAQWFVLVRKAFEHPQVQELLIANMDLDEVVYSSNQLCFKFHSIKDLKFLPFFFFHLKLHLIHNLLRLRGGRLGAREPPALHSAAAGAAWETPNQRERTFGSE